MRILHFADIHIKNSRYIEYKKIFLRLKKKIRKHELSENDFIIIAGDIFDRKDEYAPNEINLFHLFLRALKSPAKIIIIPGNHDGVVSSTNLLRPLITKQIAKTYNIIFSDKTEIIETDKIDFYHFCCLDADRNQARSLPSKDKTKALILHETITGSSNDDGFKFQNKINISPQLDEYDMIFLGDIHKFQILGNAIYPSSLIQQNRGEHPTKHGYVEWIINDEIEINFHEVENPLGSIVKANFVDGKLSDIPKIKIKEAIIFTDQLSSSELRNKLSETINAKKITIISERKFKPENVELLTFDKYIDDHFSGANNYKVDLKLKYSEYENKIPSESIVWELHSVSWKGLCIYDNTKMRTIDFSEMGNITTIIGPNASGKSSIFDIIYVTLFGKTKKGVKKDIINKNERYGFSSAIFSSKSKRYEIKIYHRKSKSDAVLIRLSDGKTIAEQFRNVYKTMASLVGTAEMFSEFNIMCDDFLNFARRKSEERNRQALSCVSFPVALRTMANKERLAIGKEIKFLEGQFAGIEIDDISYDKESLMEEKKSLEDKMKKMPDIEKTLFSIAIPEIPELPEKLTLPELDDTNITYKPKEVISKLDKKEVSELYDRKIDNAKIRLKNILESQKTLCTLDEQISQMHLDKEIFTQNARQEISDYKDRINTEIIEYKKTASMQFDILGCNFCKTNSTILDKPLTEKIASLNLLAEKYEKTKLAQLKTKTKDISDRIQAIVKRKDHLSSEIKAANKKACELEIIHLQKEKETRLDEIDKHNHMADKIEIYNEKSREKFLEATKRRTEYEKAVKHNEMVDNMESTIQNKIKIREKLILKQTKLRKCLSELNDAKLRINNIINLLAKLENVRVQKEKKNRLFRKIEKKKRERMIINEIYQLTDMKKGKFVCKKIKLFFDHLSSKFNEYTRQSNINIVLKYSDQFIINNNVPLNQCSGFEQAVISFILHYILMKQSGRNFRTNLLLIDEIFSVCDKKNISKAASLIGNINDAKLMIISHDSTIKTLGNELTLA